MRMIGFEDMAQVHMAPVHSVRVPLTHMVVAGMVATAPGSCNVQGQLIHGSCQLKLPCFRFEAFARQSNASR